MTQLQQEADHIVEYWKTLSREIEHLDGHGLSRGESARITSIHGELVPFVARIAAAFVQR